MFSLPSSWLTPELMTRPSRSLSELRTEAGWSVWHERRPEEKGRGVVTGRAPDGTLMDLTPAESDVGSVLHYGGGAWAFWVTPEGVEVYFTHRREGGLWRSVNGGPAVCLLAASDMRFADLALSPASQMLFCVREQGAHGAESVDLVALTLQGEKAGTLRAVAEGADFMHAPRPSPDGKKLAWVEWDFPNMPWTATRLCVADLTGLGMPEKTILVPEHDPNTGQQVSTVEPFWSITGDTLYALTDLLLPDQTEEERHWTPVSFQQVQGRWHTHLLPPAPAEIGQAAWVFGQSTCRALDNGSLLARGLKNGLPEILKFDPKNREAGWQTLDFPGQPESVPQPLSSTGEEFAWINAPADQPPAVVRGSLLKHDIQSVRTAWSLPEGLEGADISKPQVLKIPVAHGPGPLQALYTPPASGPHCVQVSGRTSAPPMVVIVHGGPTAHARGELGFKVQWWATRGFAVLEVNYRGSTGFGRAYREALAGQWGLLDVEDCLTATRYAIEHGLADPARCVIRGSSAGGLTVLAALARSEVFRAGTSLYGVTDLRALAEETHRFEARYLDGLVAPWPSDEAVYVERSPLSWPERITAPVLFLHGGRDTVVPLAQAEALHAKLPASALHLYPEEGHGFRAPDTISDSLQRELAFYQEVFGACSDGVSSPA